MKKNIKMLFACASLLLLAGCSNVHVSKDGNSLEIGQTKKSRAKSVGFHRFITEYQRISVIYR
ncbi:hypothetical protein, partial [uncultured Lactobacillus sp.]|uniref:hypothetical protein n=1 Tax=uncultured Lactobacillus sp. TaxID=153152 RepID=UPI00261FECBA